MKVSRNHFPKLFRRSKGRDSSETGYAALPTAIGYARCESAKPGGAEEWRLCRDKTKNTITPIKASTPITTPAIMPDLSDVLEGLGEEAPVVVEVLVTMEGPVVVGGGRFVNSAEAALVIIDSAASITLEQIEPKSDTCVQTNKFHLQKNVFVLSYLASVHCKTES
jgi:hypothetical protein